MLVLTSLALALAGCPGPKSISPADTTPYAPISFADLAAIERGYVTSQARQIAPADDPDVAKLYEMRDAQVQTRGRIEFQTEGRTVGVYVRPEDGDDAILIIMEQGLSADERAEYQARFGEEVVTVYMTIRYVYREISTDPFEVEGIQRADGSYIDFR